jgi:hypothetical protein
VSVKSEATLTINVVDRDVQLAMLRAARRPLLQAEVEEEKPGSSAGDASPDEGE